MIFYILAQCTWGFLQSTAGFVTFLLNIRKKHYLFHGAVVTEWNLRSSLSSADPSEVKRIFLSVIFFLQPHYSSLYYILTFSPYKRMIRTFRTSVPDGFSNAAAVCRLTFPYIQPIIL